MNSQTKQKLYLWLAIVGLVIVIICMATCKGDTGNEKASAPEVVGSFQPQEPIHDTIFDTLAGKVVTVQDRALLKELERVRKEYDELDQAFMNYNDSTQQAKYREAIEPREFETEFDNDTINIFMRGIVMGEVKSIYPKYRIKKRDIEVKCPYTRFRLLGGIKFGATKEFDRLNAGANLGFQGANGDLLTLEYNTQNVFSVGYSKTIFQIKK